MISLCFLFLPFTYFYADEALSSDDEINDILQDGFSDDEDDETASKSRKGFSFLRSDSSSDGAFSKFVDRSYKALRHTVSAIP